MSTATGQIWRVEAARASSLAALVRVAALCLWVSLGAAAQAADGTTPPSPPAPPSPPDATIRAAPEPLIEGPDGEPGLDPAVPSDGGAASAPVSEPPGDVDAPTPSATPPPAGDPPAQVGRLRALTGTVLVASEATNGEGQPALVNRPLTANDALSTGADGFAELSVQGGYVWLAPRTRLHVLRVDASGALVRLHEGSLAFHADGQGPTIQIELPGDVSVRSRTGTARIDAPSAGGSAMVRTEADASVVVQRAGRDQALGAGLRLRLQGEAAPERTPAEPRDPFGAWFAARDAARAPRLAPAKQSETLRHVSAAMPGYEDLADNGRWRSTPEYGAIWQPTGVQVGWAPYRYGHWGFVLPWGWTWVDDASWGFAPFHYGRWVYWQNAWAWAPGAFWAQPVYAPHLVAWGGGLSGYVSWYPLGWGAAWQPAYPCSYGYAQQLNRPYAHVGPGNVGPRIGGPHGLGRPQPFAISQVTGGAFMQGAHTADHLRPYGPGAAASAWSFRPPAAPPAAAHAWAARQPGVAAPVISGPRVGGPGARAQPVYGGTYGRPGVVSPMYRSPYAYPSYRHEPRFGPGPSPVRPLGGSWMHMHNGGIMRPGASHPGSFGGFGGGSPGGMAPPSFGGGMGHMGGAGHMGGYGPGGHGAGGGRR